MRNMGSEETPPQPLPPPASTIAGEADFPTHLLSRIRISIPGYQLLNEIAHGGQAIVYKASRKSTGETVAIKILHHGPLAGEAARQRLKREITALESIRHPNIVNILDSGESADGHEYLVMEYLQGRTLEDFITNTGSSAGPPVDRKLLLGIFQKVCSGVAAAHAVGVTHRDLSPSNILVGPELEPKVVDFGLARTSYDSLFGGSHLSVTGQFMGKLAYASPEQTMASRGTVDRRSDVYALGVILYRIATGGRFPYSVEGEPHEIVREICHTRPASPSAVARNANRRRAIGQRDSQPLEVDVVLEAIILHALEKDPDRRYPSAAELEQDIANYLAGKPTIAQPRHVWQVQHWPLSAQSVKSVVQFFSSRRRAMVSIAIPVTIAAFAITARKFLRHPTTIAPAPTPITESASQPSTEPSAIPPVPRLTFGTPEIHGGNWSVEGDDLIQSSLSEPNALILFGDPTWSDYDLTVKVTAISASDTNGFKILFHCKDAENFYTLSLGNGSETGFALSCRKAGQWQHETASYRKGNIEFGRLYEVRLSIRGTDFRCYLDGDELFHTRDDAFKGRIGLVTSQAAARFREIRVSSVDGKILWNGPPTLAQTVADVQTRVRELLERNYRGHRETGEIVEMSLDEMKKTSDNRDDEDFKVVNHVPRIRAHAAIDALISLRNALADPKSSDQDNQDLLQTARKTVKEAISTTDGVTRVKVREYFYYWNKVLDPIAVDKVEP